MPAQCFPWFCLPRRLSRSNLTQIFYHPSTICQIVFSGSPCAGPSGVPCTGSSGISGLSGLSGFLAPPSRIFRASEAFRIFRDTLRRVSGSLAPPSRIFRASEAFRIFRNTLRKAFRVPCTGSSGISGLSGLSGFPCAALPDFPDERSVPDFPEYSAQGLPGSLARPPGFSGRAKRSGFSGILRAGSSVLCARPFPAPRP